MFDRAHYLDPSLLTNNATAGNAFQSYLQHDPKLIEYSYPIFRSVIDELKTEIDRLKIWRERVGKYA